jgi:hypothetical protein
LIQIILGERQSKLAKNIKEKPIEGKEERIEKKDTKKPVLQTIEPPKEIQGIKLERKIINTDIPPFGNWKIQDRPVLWENGRWKSLLKTFSDEDVNKIVFNKEVELNVPDLYRIQEYMERIITKYTSPIPEELFNVKQSWRPFGGFPKGTKFAIFNKQLRLSLDPVKPDTKDGITLGNLLNSIYRAIWSFTTRDSDKTFEDVVNLNIRDYVNFRGKENLVLGFIESKHPREYDVLISK